MNPIFNPALRLRRAARLIVIDPDLRALMFRYDVPGRPPFWVTAGGECEPGESFRQAARRELFEETGIIATDIGPEIARMTPEFVTVEGELVQAYERFFLIRVADAHVDTSRHTALEQQMMTQHRWFTLAELESWHEAIFPVEIAAIIRSAIATCQPPT